MNNFFKTFFAVLLAVFVSFVLFIVFGVVLVSVMASSFNAESFTEIKDNTILRITLEENIQDRGTDSFFSNFDTSSFTTKSSLGLNDILRSIKAATSDNKIKGIYLELGPVNADLTIVEEIRNALLEFKKSGKFIYCRSDSFTQKTYFLGSIADHIYLTPAGNMEFVGLSMQVMFYKNAMEKLGIEPQIIRHGKFKSAVEPFMLEEMSAENRSQLTMYSASVWNDMISKISIERKISTAELNRYANGLLIATAEKAVEYKLVDGLKYADEVLSVIAEANGTTSAEDLSFMELAEYINVSEKSVDKTVKESAIAVIYATGDIVSGEGNATTIGSLTLSEALKKARLDDKIKAIVLRINSPGGDALASEIILREVILAKAQKSVIVSMGEYAASGGYYIACNANTIIADPTTVTGSIGVFGVFFNADKLLSDKLGVTVNTVNTNVSSDIGAFYRPMSPDERKYMQTSIDDVYSKFITHVSNGRNLTIEQVDAIGQGRVWSGKNAVEVGLVDELGGLEYAITRAAEIAQIDEYQIINLPELKDPFEQLYDTFSSNVKNKVLRSSMGSEYIYYAKLQELLRVQGVQARIPYILEAY